jgi:diguanylate cyclase (GGDEF)-like protein
MVVKNKFKLSAIHGYILFLIFSILIYGYLYMLLPKLESKMENKLLKMNIEDVDNMLDNTISLILKKVQNEDIVAALLKDKYLRKDLETMLSSLTTKHIEYIYIVFKAKNNFRYLLDASKKEKARTYELFEPLYPEKWEKVYKTAVPEIIIQKDINTLGFTFLKPIIQKGKVKAIVAVDYSTTKMQELSELISKIKTFLIGLIVLSFIILNGTVYGGIKSYYLRKKAFKDSLTGLYNRTYLEEIYDQINLKNYHIALLDIDYFKNINDSFGHDAGDKVLKEVAKILTKDTRKFDDIVIRYGGEEFLIFIRKSSRKFGYQSLNIIERIWEDIQKKKIRVDKEHVIDITASIGLNISTENEKFISEAIKKADIALYRAKNTGRNKIEIYDEDKEKSSKLVSINLIKELIENKSFICHYQPIIDLASNKIAYFEALVRLIDKDGNLIYPNDFLPVIQNTYLYSKLTKEIINYNVEILKMYPSIVVSINLTPTDLFNKSTILLLKEIAKDKDISKRIYLEIVETENIISYQKMENTLKTLKSLNYTIGIDDFGSGYSNFIYLIKMNVDFLKIDANLIKNLDKDDMSYVVVSTIKNFCKETGIKTVAEFAENRIIYEKIKELGIDYVQGYYLGKPEPIDDAINEENNNEI